MAQTFAMAMLSAMSAADLIEAHFRQRASLDRLQAVRNRAGDRLKNLQSRTLETRQSPPANTADDNSIDLLAGQRFERLALTVTMPQIEVLLLGNRAGIDVDQQKHRSRAEMIKHQAFKA